MLGGVRDRTIEALTKYGEKAKAVLRVALSIYDQNGESELGHFDYKTLYSELQSLGYSWDPKMILRALERDFGIIETSYKSSNQHWWKFIDAEEVRNALEEGEEDPEVKLVKIQANSLDIEGIEKRLDFMLKKPRITEVDRAMFRRIAFEDLRLAIEVYKKAEMYEETQYIANRIRRVLSLADKVSLRLNGKGNDKGLLKEKGEGQADYADGLRLLDGEDIGKKQA
ncbi:MAG: hypothetical protein ASUL_07074 [Candidatus Aramenus sulfurataquae]|uniref:Uncharacterized protein n=1 Tax=Candidatus Aramenus sulfurataquae TaxID=1326980 RepID=W7KUJ3_9CREN|nr:MAG: hypothetical protein ASUL_07074 [Candidatus Aramenus sulfurataquae]MCL7343592.1 hypothetical protein [Candidatus Aramenus sulfurataquae]